MSDHKFNIGDEVRVSKHLKCSRLTDWGYDGKIIDIVEPEHRNVLVAPLAKIVLDGSPQFTVFLHNLTLLNEWWKV